MISIKEEIMKNVLFNNYYDSEREQYARENILEDRGEDNGWENVDDIPDEEVWDELNFQEEIEWEETISDLKRFFDGKTLLVTGTVGTWQGNFAGGKVLTVENISDCWKNCDYIEIYDENGHFYIRSSHHDGTNLFEVKVLTEKGADMWDKYEYDYIWRDLSIQDVHGKLYNNSRYSHIPHYARNVWGCKTR